ncbi:acyl-CoA dehydrogenase family protein [Pseudoxanthomonas winnipegensis]|uniref:Dehydrogenase n=1 Tax=Pseudoxanthomonas winnipegensis TaxID=2480810 RepID=A0A4Q8LF27_9GAMM|nr:acyl-CoA dehydrogenase family protein [Pseudoxanthomonas winnipegensis]RZZ81889.1 dehydrogenase [Pseudoxanthomonas winnipegensis]TAA27791.1 dehydrogenase [Pseudoxanthomonas winnipegensis]TAA42242.1 dehydrogenase [Pseudoxanthomonas winnipegensis]TBV69981.1 dehydrogenase [Pseudoxanthomonas winnipegensis]
MSGANTSHATALHVASFDTSGSDWLASRVRRQIRETPDLPRPGGGETLERWRALARFGAESLPLVKVMEAHYDALAILAEAGEPRPPADTLWAVWAAGGPTETVRYDAHAGRVSGIKPWCSGPQGLISHALVTVAHDDRRPLAAITLAPGTFRLDASQWSGPGMVGVPTGEGHFSAAAARLVSTPEFYLERPGFWHGGAGIAACWFGAATAIAERVRRSPGVSKNPFCAAHLGAIDAQLTAAQLMLRQLARDIDRQPQDSHRYAVTGVRCFVDRVCRDVMERAALALGPASLCTDAEHAQRCADLQAFIRQCHGQRDEQWLGEALHQAEGAWTL